MGKKVKAKKVTAKPVVKEVAKAETKVPEKKPVVKVEAKKPEPVKKEDAKKADPKVLPGKSEIVDVPDACDAVADGFKTKGKVGFYDVNSADCKQCGEEYPAAQTACKSNTEIEASQVKAKKAVKKEKAVRTDLSAFGHYGKAAILDAALLDKKGASMKELLVIRGAVSSHFSHLKAVHGATVEKKDGRYYVSLLKPQEVEKAVELEKKGKK